MVGVSLNSVCNQTAQYDSRTNNVSVAGQQKKSIYGKIRRLLVEKGTSKKGPPKSKEALIDSGVKTH